MVRMKLSNYANPFDAVSDFEDALTAYTGAKYAITTDSCTHAIELCFRYKQIMGDVSYISIPNKTYLSVPMIFPKLGLAYHIRHDSWKGEYRFGHTNIWDSARLLEERMYRKGQMQCLSFGRTKPIEIGRGGAILLDDYAAYETIKRMSYDGRDLRYSPWSKQQDFLLGFHYMMRPEEAVIGHNKLFNRDFVDQDNNFFYNYPDISKLNLPTV